MGGGSFDGNPYWECVCAGAAEGWSACGSRATTVLFIAVLVEVGLQHQEPWTVNFLCSSPFLSPSSTPRVSSAHFNCLAAAHSLETIS